LLNPALLGSTCGCLGNFRDESNFRDEGSDEDRSQAYSQAYSQGSGGASVAVAAARLLRPSTGACLPAVAAAADYLAAVALLAQRLAARPEGASPEAAAPAARAEVSGAAAGGGSSAVADGVCAALGAAAAALARLPPEGPARFAAPGLLLTLTRAARTLASLHPAAAGRWLQPLLGTDGANGATGSSRFPNNTRTASGSGAALAPKNNNSEPPAFGRLAGHAGRRGGPPELTLPLEFEDYLERPSVAPPSHGARAVASRAAATASARAHVAAFHAADARDAPVAAARRAETGCRAAAAGAPPAALEAAAAAARAAARAAAVSAARAEASALQAADAEAEAVAATAATAATATTASPARRRRNAVVNSPNEFVSALAFPSPLSEAQASAAAGAMFNAGDGVWQALTLDRNPADPAALRLASSVWRVAVDSALQPGDASSDGGGALALDCAVDGTVVGALALPAPGSAPLSGGGPIELVGHFAHPPGRAVLAGGLATAVHLSVRLNRAVPAGGGNFTILRAGQVDLHWHSAP
jgi:hypothetical protein